MPIRLVDKQGALGALAVTSSNVTVNFDGTHSVPSAATGTIGLDLEFYTASLSGLFSPETPLSTGTIAVGLSAFLFNGNDTDVGPYAIDAVLQEEDFDGNTITGTSKNTGALFRDQTWNVQGRYTYRIINIPTPLSITGLVGGDFTYSSGTPGTYPFDVQVWDSVLAAVILDSSTDGSFNPQATIT